MNMKFCLKYGFLAILQLIMLNQVCADEKIPWSQRIFPNAPRISAEQAKKLLLSKIKIVIIDVPWTLEGFRKGHICGAIRSPTKKVEDLDRLLKKIPKDYLILSYCK